MTQNLACSSMKSAQKLMALGLRIVPLQPAEAGNTRSGKLPLTTHGVKDATADFQELARIVGDRQCNFGVATGIVSGVVVLDIDPRNGGDASLHELEQQHGALPDTWTVATGGGGRHYYFRAPKRLMKKRTVAPGVDFLAEGAYAVAPPSFHGSGKRYTWKHAPRAIELAKLPSKWLAFLRVGSTTPKEQPRKKVQKDDHREQEIMVEGSRNDELTRLAGQMRQTGLEEAELVAALRAINKRRCKPPLPDDEVRAIAQSVARYHAGHSADPGEQLANAFVKKIGAGSLLRYERDGRFWTWSKNCWLPVDDNVIQADLLKLAPSVPTTARRKGLVQDALALLKMRSAVRDDALHFRADPPMVINLENGELWLDRDGGPTLRPHNPRTGMRDLIPVAFDPDATCELYDRTVREIFSRAKDPEALVSVFEELLGYVIQPSRKIPLIILLLGSGSNGKTTLVSLMRTLMGPGLVHSGRVEDLERNQFAIGSLLGKRLFIDDDVKAGAKLPDGTLKRISEAKLLTGERKHRDPFEFTCRAFPVLLCNNVPSLADVSPGMMRRLQVIPFDRRFKETEIDRDLLDRIISSELPGVLNRALAGWARLQKTGRVTKSPDVIASIKQLAAQANPLLGFIDECCLKDAEARISLSDFYSAYRIWAQESGFTLQQSNTTVRRNLEHQGFGIRRHGAGRMVFGLSLR